MIQRPDEKLEAMLRREYLIEEYRGVSRVDLILRIKELETKLAIAEHEQADCHSNESENNKEPTGTTKDVMISGRSETMPVVHPQTSAA